MMCRTRPVVLLALALLVCAPRLFAYDVALRSGAVIHFKNCRVVNQELLYIAEDGIEKSVLLSDINFERTRELNASAYPPLDLDGWIKQMNAPKKTLAATPSQPLGDVARELRLKGVTDPQGHVFTDDDFPKSPGAPPSANASSEASPGRLNSPSSPGASTTASDWAASKAKIEQFLSDPKGSQNSSTPRNCWGPDSPTCNFPSGRPGKRKSTPSTRGMLMTLNCASPTAFPMKGGAKTKRVRGWTPINRPCRPYERRVNP
jgi:hypothetical protein